MSIHELQLKIKLLSDTTFGRGDGVAGLIDQEVEHDSYGFPYLRGRTLKGLLSEECDNLVAVLPNNCRQHWQAVKDTLFGVPGSTLETMSIMHVGDACLPEPLRQAVADQIEQLNSDLTKVEVLDSLTTIRRQTAISPENGTPVDRSLRSARVVVRDRSDAKPRFTALLFFDEEPTPDMKALLAVGTLALRRIGSGRNRGRGHVQCTLCEANGQEITQRYVHRFGTVEKANS